MKPIPVSLAAFCMLMVSLAMGAEIKLKTGEVIRGDLGGKLVFKAGGGSSARPGGVYVLFQGENVVAIDESGIRLRGGHVTVATLTGGGCGKTPGEALQHVNQDGWGSTGDHCDWAVFTAGLSHPKVWDKAYKKALDPYVHEEGADADGEPLRRIVGSGLLLGRLEGKEVLPSLEVKTTGPAGEGVITTVPVRSVVQFKRGARPGKAAGGRARPEAGNLLYVAAILPRARGVFSVLAELSGSPGKEEPGRCGARLGRAVAASVA